MKLIYDLRLLSGQMHGMARYALELLKALLAQDPDLSVGALLRSPVQAPLLPSNPRLVAIACKLRPYSLTSQLSLPKLLDGLRPEVYHCPFYAPPFLFKGPMVFTVHDLIHLRFPEHHGLKHRLFYRWVVSPAARRARAVLTVSQNSKRDLVELLGVPEKKIVVTPIAAGTAFRPPAEAAVAPDGWPRRYLLAVGNPKPHKNLAAAVAAHRLLRQGQPPGLEVPPLVLVGVGKGQADWARPDEGLRLVPYLSDEQLAAAYAAAQAVVIPSLYEGFGLPALEALACGAPLVCSNRASLPEVVGQAALLSDPTPQDLARALGALLADRQMQERLRAAGPRQAAQFSWDRTARATLEVYRRAAVRGPGA